MFERLWQSDFWYLIPLIAAVSLVYSATRHERMNQILRHALRLSLWIFGFMFVVFLLLFFLSVRYT